MAIQELLHSLQQLDIRLWTEGDQLRYSAPSGALTPELRERIVAQKPEIIAYLKVGASSGASVIPQASRQEPAPLSFAQQRIWFFTQFEPDSPTYNIPTRFALHGALDIPTLERCLTEIVRRHEALRTRFVSENGQPVQVVAEPSEIRVRYEDLRNAPAEERAALRQRIEEAERYELFDLEASPLLRAAVLQTTETDFLLLLTLHHIAGDGWTMSVVTRELETLYRAYRQGAEPNLPTLPIQYADFAVWQRDWIQEAAQQKQLDYWQARFETLPPTLQLPTDRPRPPRQTFQGRNETTVLPLSLLESIQGLSRPSGATLFMTLLTAYYALLHRYTGQTDLCVGTPIANRNRQEIEGLIGFFVNTLALRTDASGDPTFKELLERTREVALGAYEHQDTPFEKLVEVLAPERNLSVSPLFQTLFVLQNTPPPTLSLPDCAPSRLQYSEGASKFDLTLFHEETPDGLLITLEYNTALFDAETMRRLLGHYRTLLEAAVANPNRRLSELPLLTEAERQQILGDWNATYAAPGAYDSLHGWVESWAERQPDAIAVEFGAERVTYAELNRRANRLAHWLRAQGVQANSRVGICQKRSIEAVVAMLATLKAGGGYVPFNPNDPPERLAALMEDAQLTALLGKPSPPDPLSHAAGEGERSGSSDVAEERSDANLPDIAEAESLTYVLYTSGSTGKPKGVAMHRRPLLNLIEWVCRTTNLPPGARTLQFPAYTFDVSFQDIFSTWCMGGTLVLTSEEERMDFPGLWRLLREKRIERIYLPVVALQSLAETFQPERDADLPLRKIVTSGEALTITPAMRRMFERLPECRLHNEYGPTETHVVTEFALPRDPNAWADTPSIGRPISNVYIYLLDNRQNLVPIGVPGELYIGGVAPALGYLNRPDWTAEKFLALYGENIASSVPPATARRLDHSPSLAAWERGSGGEGVARLYRTGDRAKWLPDGTIAFLGRQDHQVKIRGFRVELGEIEEALRGHEAIREVVVRPWEASPTDRRLAAWLILKNGRVPTTSELRAYLAERLPDYMIPAAFTPVERFPLNANGKVDAKALPTPEAAVARSEADYAAPTEPLERTIAGIWQAALHAERVGVNDNFFDLGGHSLLIVQVQQNLQQALNREIAVVDLFRFPTVRALATYLGAEEKATQETAPIQDRAQRQREAQMRQRQFALQRGRKP